MSATDVSWFVGRGTGTVALVLLTLVVVLGVVQRSGRSVGGATGPGLSRFGVGDLHRTAALTGVGLVAVHVGALLLDPYAQLRVTDLVVPFLAALDPWWQGLGTVAVDVAVVLTLSSLLRHRIGPRAFRALHWSAYALWPLAFLHGLGSGTDAATLWFRLVAVACGLAVVAAVTWRTSATFGERGQARRPRVTLTGVAR